MPTFDEFRKSVETGGINFNKPEVVSKNVENNDWWSKFIKDKQQYQLTNNTFAVKSILNDMSVLPAITKLAEDIEKYITKLVKPDNKDQQDKIKNSIKTLDKVSKTTKTTFQKFSDTTARYLERAGELIEETVKFMDSSFTFSRKVKLGGSKLLTALGNALAPGAVYSGLANTYSGISKHIEKFITGTMRTLFSTFSNSESTNKIISGFEWVISKTFTVFSWIAKTGFYLLDRAWALIKGLAKIGWGVIKGVFSTIYDLTLSIGDFFVDLMIEIFSNPILLASALVLLKYTNTGKFLTKTILDAASSFLEKVWNATTDIVNTKFGGSLESLLTYIGFDANKRTEIIGSITGIFKTVFDIDNLNKWWNSSFGKLFGMPKDSFSNMIDGITSFGVGLWDSVSGIFKKLFSSNFKERVSEMWTLVKGLVSALSPSSSFAQEQTRSITNYNFDAVLASQIQPYASSFITREIFKYINDKYDINSFKTIKDIKPKLMEVANNSLNGFITSLGVSDSFKQKIQTTLMNEVSISLDSIVESIISSDNLKQMQTDTNIQYLNLRKDIEVDLDYVYGALNDYSTGGMAELAEQRLTKFINKNKDSNLSNDAEFSKLVNNMNLVSANVPGMFNELFNSLSSSIEYNMKNTDIGLTDIQYEITKFQELSYIIHNNQLNASTFSNFIDKLKTSQIKVSPLVYQNIYSIGKSLNYEFESNGDFRLPDTVMEYAITHMKLYEQEGKPKINDNLKKKYSNLVIPDIISAKRYMSMFNASQKDIEMLLGDKYSFDTEFSDTLYTALSAPKLATGGVVKDATLTWVGEGKSEEMVIPINKEGIQFIYNVTKNIEANEKKKKVTKVRNYYENYGPTEPDETLYDLRNMATGFVEAM